MLGIELPPPDLAIFLAGQPMFVFDVNRCHARALGDLCLLGRKIELRRLLLPQKGSRLEVNISEATGLVRKSAAPAAGMGVGKKPSRRWDAASINALGLRSRVWRLLERA